VADAYEYGNAFHYGPNVVTPALTLPAAGERNRLNGQAAGRGSRGYYWSSTENGSTAYNLHFTGGVFPAHTSIRTSGYSVRCIAE
jgi:hypothetical protein